MDGEEWIEDTQGEMNNTSIPTTLRLTKRVI